MVEDAEPHAQVRREENTVLEIPEAVHIGRDSYYIQHQD